MTLAVEISEKRSDVTSRQMPAVAGLLHIQPRWLQEHPCFFDADPKVVRAVFNMLAAAWKNAPHTSISANFDAAAHVAGLDSETFALRFQDLCFGWQLRDGRLVHLEMQDLCDRLWARHGAIFEQFEVDCAAAIEAPEEFELRQPELQAKRTSGRKLLPPAWVPSAESVKRLDAMGYAPESVQMLVQTMRDWAKSKAEKKNDWDATLMNFARSSPPPPRPGVPMVSATQSRFGGFMNKGEVARATNQSVMASIRSQERSGA